MLKSGDQPGRTGLYIGPTRGRPHGNVALCPYMKRRWLYAASSEMNLTIFVSVHSVLSTSQQTKNKQRYRMLFNVALLHDTAINQELEHHPPIPTFRISHMAQARTIQKYRTHILVHAFDLTKAHWRSKHGRGCNYIAQT